MLVQRPRNALGRRQSRKRRICRRALRQKCVNRPRFGCGRQHELIEIAAEQISGGVFRIAGLLFPITGHIDAGKRLPCPLDPHRRGPLYASGAHPGTRGRTAPIAANNAHRDVKLQGYLLLKIVSHGRKESPLLSYGFPPNSHLRVVKIPVLPVISDFWHIVKSEFRVIRLFLLPVFFVPQPELHVGLAPGDPYFSNGNAGQFYPFFAGGNGQRFC